MSEEIKEISTPETVETGGDLYEVDDIANAFMEGEEAAMGDETPEAEPEAVQPENVPEDGAESTPEYPMPEGWEQTMWDGMAPDVRGAVDKLVKGHADAISAKEKAMQDAFVQHREAIAKANAEMQTSLDIMRQVVEGEFRNIDWEGVKKSDPSLFVELQDAYRQRMGAIQQMQQQVASQQAQIAQQQAAELQKSMQSELNTVLPKIKALVGSGYTGEGFRNELSGYLQKSGVPVEVIGMMTKGYELELATKAMLYDKFQSARDAAAAKVASAPTVQSPRGVEAADGGDKLKSARQALSRNPNSTEALARLFEAM